jgi:quinone-modifying oxidoreductase, subunit QmoC
MADRYRIEPDGQFLREILAGGGEDLKKCFQCATCSVVCELSTGDRPFPRKEMIWAQWGLKDRLVSDPDLWLCHRCNDCITKCPRGARPGDVMAALRQQAVMHYSVPRSLGPWMNRLSVLPLLLLVPALLLGLALLVRGPLENVLPFKPEHAFYAQLFPHWLLIGFFSFFSGVAFLVAAVGGLRFWQAMSAADRAAGEVNPAVGWVESLIRTLKSLGSHRKFSQCTSASSLRVVHLLIFYGFVALFIVTIWAVIDLYVNPLVGISSLYPFGLLHPLKILANLGCIMLIAGCVMAIRDHLADDQPAGKTTAFDWIFVGELLAVGISGLIVEVFRFAHLYAPSLALRYAAYTIYFIHLVLVFALLIYLPYSKFAHILYRMIALVYAERMGRVQVSVDKTQ